MSIEAHKRPLVTFCVVAYKQEQFIRGAVESAFAQTYSPLEIILTDDCSPDRTFEIMEEMASGYRGPHRLILNRNPKNLGIGNHVNKLVSLANGELLVAAAGDDISLPERTELTYQVWEASGRKALLLLADAIEFDQTGHEVERKSPKFVPGKHFDEALENFDGHCGCTEVFSPELFRIFGPLQAELSIEDKPILLRALLAGEVAYVPHTLVRYRRHSGVSTVRRPRWLGLAS